MTNKNKLFSLIKCAHTIDIAVFASSVDESQALFVIAHTHRTELMMKVDGTSLQQLIDSLMLRF